MFIGKINSNNPCLQWREALQLIVDNAGKPTYKNEVSTYIVPRNGAKCHGIKQVNFFYDGADHVPVMTERKIPINLAIKEFICYLRGYTTLEQFHSIGVTTWDKDASSNQSWLTNPARKGEGDLGRIYGAVARAIKRTDGTTFDMLNDVIERLKAGDYNRRLIVNFYDPLVEGALPACMYEHTFTVENNKLNLTSIQRSCDALLGGAFNAVQSYFFLHLVCNMTGYAPGIIQHVIHDLHIYDNQMEEAKLLLSRQPLEASTVLTINPEITTLQQVEELPVESIYDVAGYKSLAAIKIELTV